MKVWMSAACSLACLLVSPAAGWAQFEPFGADSTTPQAKIQEEFDAFVELVLEEHPQERLALVENFLSRYPDSEFAGLAYQYQMLSFERLNDAEMVIRAGSEVLRRLPDNLHALVTLASAIPNVADAEPHNGLLERAEGYARRALRVLEKKRIPREIPLIDWEAYRTEMASRLHEALGHVALKRAQTAEAVAHFEKAVETNPTSVGRQYFRLGVAYAWIGRNDDARKALQKAAKLGPELIRQLSRNEIAKLDGEIR